MGSIGGLIGVKIRRFKNMGLKTILLNIESVPYWKKKKKKRKRRSSILEMKFKLEIGL